MRGYGGHERRGDSVIYPPTGEVMGWLHPRAEHLRRALLANGFRVERRG